ncbi:hypothetical protein AAC387_Pa02g3830 [Persea americana]
MDSHQSKVLYIGILLATLTIPCFSADCNFPAVFNFGDSNSDTGGWSAGFGRAGSPAGETYFHYPAGRYCDGRLMIDFIAQSLGLHTLHSYLDAVEFNSSHGINFATAGSTIRRPNTTGFSPFSLDVQFSQYSQFRTRYKAAAKEEIFKGLLPKEEYFSEGLYTFDIGQNDLTSGFFGGMTADEVKAAVPDILNQFSNIVKNIYWQGGRSFWIHNTGPFGCLAYVLDKIPLRTPEVDKYGCGNPFNSVAQYFNEKLKEVVVQLRKDLPLAALTYVDIYSLKYTMISQASKFGFKEPLVACCGHGGKYNYNDKVGCGGYIYVNGTAVLIGKSCEDPSVKINWDGVHYTEAANKWVFDRIVDGSFSDPPIPIKMACNREAQ